jgi:DNA-binding response OmpR family regulator
MKRDGVIFLLENSTEYLFLLDQSFRRSQIYNPLRVARYGNEAILYLKGVGIYSDRIHYPLPELLIIDLALPDGSGLAVLGWIRRQLEFNHVPVVILVDPSQSESVQEAFDRRANAYYLKRDDFDGLAKMVRRLQTVAEANHAESTPLESVEDIKAEL